jgi:hypothetical protein
MKATEGQAHSEAADPKYQRVRFPQGTPSTCPFCKKWNRHAADCPNMTIEAALEREKQAKQSADWAKQRAAYWLNECRKMHGKLAMLKAENNKLRAKLKP